MSETKPIQRYDCKPETRLCIGSNAGRIHEKLKLPRAMVCSVNIKWKKFGTTNSFPRYGHTGQGIIGSQFHPLRPASQQPSIGSQSLDLNPIQQKKKKKDPT